MSSIAAMVACLELLSHLCDWCTDPAFFFDRGKWGNKKATRTSGPKAGRRIRLQ